jgi:catechol 2,3-dioxygenase-like lactoylglutathione lyase family enzyme
VLDHIDFAVTNLDRSRAYYTSVLSVLGIEPFMEIDREDGHKGIGFGSHNGPQFWIGGGRAVGGRLHIAFAASSRSEVDDFYRTALEAGGTSRGAPGARPNYGKDYYAAFVTDPDGHVLEAVCRRPGQSRGSSTGDHS